MNISWLTLRDLEYFVAVEQYGHFGRAAEACHVSQPALSTQIKKIEEILGVQLFERTNRRVSITRVGRVIGVQARVVLDEAKKITQLAQNHLEAMAGTLNLGAIASLGPYYLPFFIPTVKKKFPKLNLILKEGLTDDLLNDLRTGTLDVVLAADTFDDQEFIKIPLFDEPFFLAAPKDHRLATKEHIRPSDLNASEMILLEDGHCLRDQALQICPVNKRGQIRKFHATSLETVKHLVAAGMGYTLIPALAIDERDRMGGLLKYRPFEARSVSRKIILVCRKKYTRIGDAQTLADYLKNNRPKELLTHG